MAVAPRPVETSHPTQLRQHGILIRPKLLHRVLLLLLGRCLLLRWWGHHHAGVVLVQVAWVRGSRLGLWGDVMRGGLGLHAWGGAGVWGLGLGSGRRLRGSHLVSQRRGHGLGLEVRRLGHLLGLLGAHGVTVLGWRPPGAQVLLLLLEQPLVDGLVEKRLGRWGLGTSLRGWRALWRLLGSPSAWHSITSLHASHGILLLLLLHLEVVLVL